MCKCNQCKFGITKYSEVELGKEYLKTNYSSPALGDMYVKCDAGNNQIILDWWLKNGSLIKDKISNVNCDKFDLPELNKKLDQVINMLDRLNKILEQEPIQIYEWKYPPYVKEELTDEEKVIKYFECQFGNEITLVKVYKYERLKQFCEHNNITKEFVLKTIKEHLRIK